MTDTAVLSRVRCINQLVQTKLIELTQYQVAYFVDIMRNNISQMRRMKPIMLSNQGQRLQTPKYAEIAKMMNRIQSYGMI